MASTFFSVRHARLTANKTEAKITKSYYSIATRYGLEGPGIESRCGRDFSHLLHNEELSDLYSLPNIVRVVKSRRMRWAGHVARMGEG